MGKNLLIVGQIAKIQHFLNCYFWVISVLACFAHTAKTSNLSGLQKQTVISCSCFRWAAVGLSVSAPCTSSLCDTGWKNSPDVGQVHTLDREEDKWSELTPAI